MSNLPKYDPKCWLAAHGTYERGLMTPCLGRLVRAHLVPARLIVQTGKSMGLTKAGILSLVWDDAAWVLACGGRDHGNAGHHGQLDTERTLHVPRSSIPQATEEFCARLGLGYFLEREYGER